MPELTKRRPAVHIVITPKYCKGCGICVELCPAKVFAAEPTTGKVLLAAPERCTACGLCELWCPDYAISLEQEARP